MELERLELALRGGVLAPSQSQPMVAAQVAGNCNSSSPGMSMLQQQAHNVKHKGLAANVIFLASFALGDVTLHCTSQAFLSNFQQCAFERDVESEPGMEVLEVSAMD